MAEQLQAYCFKCKEKREINNPEAVYLKNGAPATKGQCGVCGSTLNLMGATPAHANVPKPEVIVKSKRKKSSHRRSGKLVVVESPAKARSVGGFLGKGYNVVASKGHVRDLLVSKISVDVENDFEPTYRVPNDKRPTVKQIKSAAEKASEIYLATDPDREGEAIAWHLMQATNMEEDRVKRVVFHEITDQAVDEAFSNPRQIDMDLVNAQQARRILDRLVGYNVTELLWNKVRNRISAGRVQSIALRIVVDREKEIEVFVPEEYWTIDAELRKQQSNSSQNPVFSARLLKVGDDDFSASSEAEVMPHVEILEKSQYIVQDVQRGTRQRKPSPPFTTSTLQQEASRRLGFNARRTMSVAQQLYEGIQIGGGKSVGLITYMRTDSLSVSAQAQTDARNYISEHFGDNFMPKKPPQYKTKSKGAQEAHEAIRPTQVTRTPDSLKGLLERDQMRLYKLIWERFVASQMSNAIYNTIRVDIRAGLNRSKMPYLFRTTASELKFAGFLAVYQDTKDEDAKAESDEGRKLPDLTADEILDLIRLLPEQHFTQPPPRYTEASLVRTLEEYGIGRPSTYAPTVAVIQDRDYVNKDNKRLVPTETGRVVSDLLTEYFSDEMDYEFTARMEQQLDEIADGDVDWQPWLQEFYTPFEGRLENARKNMPQIRQEEKTGRTCPTCGTGDLIIKHGKWGKFIGCSNYPECRHTEQFLEMTGVSCPTCGATEGGELVVRRTRRGKVFYGCSRYPDCEHAQWALPKQDQESEPSAETQAELPATGTD